MSDLITCAPLYSIIQDIAELVEMETYIKALITTTLTKVSGAGGFCFLFKRQSV